MKLKQFLTRSFDYAFAKVSFVIGAETKKSRNKKPVSFI